MKRYEVIIIGAGPAGLSAAIEAAGNGLQVVVFDENARPGGQLFKQIHKFFGSREHKAKIRGFRIGEVLLKEAEELGVEVVLNATVIGIFDNKTISVMIDDRIEHIKANNIVIATGASENMAPFPGWTLPGVIGAGAAQTMMNIHGLQPGQKNIDGRFRQCGIGGKLPVDTGWLPGGGGNRCCSQRRRIWSACIQNCPPGGSLLHVPHDQRSNRFNPSSRRYHS